MHNRLDELLQAALAKTERGGLVWKAFDDESFRVAVGSGYLHLQRNHVPFESETGEYSNAVRYSVQVSDAQGRVVAEEEVTPHEPEGRGQLLPSLFNAARKTALKTDRVIEDMLGALRGGT